MRMFCSTLSIGWRIDGQMVNICECLYTEVPAMRYWPFHGQRNENSKNRGIHLNIPFLCKSAMIRIENAHSLVLHLGRLNRKANKIKLKFSHPKIMFLLFLLSFFLQDTSRRFPGMLNTIKMRVLLSDILGKPKQSRSHCSPI